MNSLVGQQAPSFTLFDTEKNKVSLEEFKGQNLLILFFPLAYTSVCTEELCSVRDNISTYQDVNAAVVGISVDSLFTLAKYKEDQKLNFPLLSDFNKSVSTDYNALYQTFSFEMAGVSKRSAFIVDKEGMIRYAEVLENAGLQPDFVEIQAMLNTLN